MSADAKSVSGDEHPSGLRDAIRETLSKASADWWDNEGSSSPNDWPLHDEHVAAAIERVVLAWLSVVSEDEIDAAARAMHDWRCDCAWASHVRDYEQEAGEVLVASRGVLIPKETR